MISLSVKKVYKIKTFVDCLDADGVCLTIKGVAHGMVAFSAVVDVIFTLSALANYQRHFLAHQN